MGLPCGLESNRCLPSRRPVGLLSRLGEGRDRGTSTPGRHHSPWCSHRQGIDRAREMPGCVDTPTGAHAVQAGAGVVHRQALGAFWGVKGAECSNCPLSSEAPDPRGIQAKTRGAMEDTEGS